MILAVLGSAALLGAAAVALRWVIGRYDALDRKRPFPWISLVVLLILGVAGLTPVVLRLRLEAQLEDAASVVAGTRVQVHCQALGEAFVDAGFELGYVKFGPDGVPERSTLIKRQQCRDLSSYLRSDRDAFSHEHVVAVHTLTHEAIHMSGVTDEAQTECLALQRNAEMAQLLGASPDAAQALASHYWDVVYPRMPDPYRSDECQPGGELDRNLPAPPWD